MRKYIASILVLMILAGLTGCKTEDIREAPPLEEPVGVQMDIAEVQYGDVYRVNTYNGMMVPYVEELQFVADGTFGEVFVQIGEKVSKGQLLATLSEESIRKQLAQLDEEIAEINTLGDFSDRQLQADIAIAKLELEALTAEEASSQTRRLKALEIEKLERHLEQARELRQLEVQEKRRKQEQLKEGLGKGQIVAPFDGTVVYIKDMTKGDAVRGYTTVMCITDDSRVYLETEYLSESVVNDADKVYAKIGQKEYVIEYKPYDPDEFFYKRVNGEEVKTQFIVKAEDGEVYIGQYAVVVINGEYKEKVLTVPVNALYEEADGYYVYKLVDGKRVRCDVSVGLISNAKAEILEGLTEGEKVYVKE